MADQTADTVTKLDPEVKAQWVAALRSGEYQQGKLCLRNKDNCYCCLGVLANLIDPAAWSQPLENEWHWQAEKDDEYEDEDGKLHVEWNHDRTENLPYRVLSSKVQDVLVELNDGKRLTDEVYNVTYVDAKSFADIADYIEVNL